MSDGETPSTSTNSEVPLQGQTDVSPVREPSPSEACSILLAQAKQAFQEHRRKDCLVITRVILAIDAANKEAQVIENWIRADLQKDIDDLRAKILKARQAADGETVHRAERLLRTILIVDPHNEQANLLLQEVRVAASELAPAVPVAEREPQAPDRTEQTAALSNDIYPGYPTEPPQWRHLYTALIIMFVLPMCAFALWKYNARPAAPAAAESASSTDASTGILEIAFTNGVQVFVNDEYLGTTPVQPVRLAPKAYHLKYKQDGKEIGQEDVTITTGNTTRNTIQQATGKLVFIVVPAKGVLLKIDGKPYGITPESADIAPGVYNLEFSAVGYAPATVNVAVSVGKRAMVPVLLKSLTAAAGDKLNNPPALPAGPAPANSARASEGELRLISSTDIDIEVYEKDRRLGVTPVIIDHLSPGPHTLEFRYEGLKKTATYNIQAGGSTTATVTFEITVNINVTPFAEVFLDPEMDLGETPLSKITVPVGGTLIFKHPKYPDKRYRITAKENAIYQAFP